MNGGRAWHQRMLGEFGWIGSVLWFILNGAIIIALFSRG